MGITHQLRPNGRRVECTLYWLDGQLDTCILLNNDVCIFLQSFAGAAIFHTLVPCHCLRESREFHIRGTEIIRIMQSSYEVYSYIYNHRILLCLYCQLYDQSSNLKTHGFFYVFHLGNSKYFGYAFLGIFGCELVPIFA